MTKPKPLDLLDSRSEIIWGIEEGTKERMVSSYQKQKHNQRNSRSGEEDAKLKITARLDRALSQTLGDSTLLFITLPTRENFSSRSLSVTEKWIFPTNTLFPLSSPDISLYVWMEAVLPFLQGGSNTGAKSINRSKTQISSQGHSSQGFKKKKWDELMKLFPTKRV